MLYESIKRLAFEKGFSINELELKADLGEGTLRRWRVRSPRLNSLEKVAKALNVTVPELLENSEKVR